MTRGVDAGGHVSFCGGAFYLGISGFQFLHLCLAVTAVTAVTESIQLVKETQKNRMDSSNGQGCT